MAMPASTTLTMPAQSARTPVSAQLLDSNLRMASKKRRIIMHFFRRPTLSSHVVPASPFSAARCRVVLEQHLSSRVRSMYATPRPPMPELPKMPIVGRPATAARYADPATDRHADRSDRSRSPAGDLSWIHRRQLPSKGSSRLDPH